MEEQKDTRKIPCASENEIQETDIVGKKFEELDPEELEIYQGSGDGDIFPEDILTITTLLSKKGYKC